MAKEDKLPGYNQLADLLGTTKPGERDIRGEGIRAYKRPSWEETKVLIESVKAEARTKTLDEIHQFAENDIPAGLEAIATSQMPLSEIPVFYETVNIVGDERSDRLFKMRYPNGLPPFSRKEMREPRKELMPREFLDESRFEVARTIAYAVAYNEGLFGPNDLGYTPDLTTSLYNKEQTVITNMRYAADYLEEYPDMFGAKTEMIYNGSVKRLNNSRAMFLGRRVMEEEFPPFPQPKPTDK